MNTLVLPSGIAKQVLEVASQELESAAVLLAKVVTLPNGDLRVLARSMNWIAAEGYVKRTSSQLLIASDGYMQFLQAAELRDEVAIFLHTHPGGTTTPSTKDKRVDEQLRDTFRNRTGSDCYGSLIAAARNGSLAIGGVVECAGVRSKIERSLIVGDKLSIVQAAGHTPETIPAYFDRNVRAFGGGIQQALGSLRVGIVGCGGIGSAVAEQLARLGVRKFILVDPDTLSGANVTRVYGSTFSRVGKPKVNVLRDHILRITDDSTVVDVIETTLINEASAKMIASCDVIFGCTDDNAARLVLSRMATYMMVPVIDSGVVLSSDAEGKLIGIDGRVTIMTPGHACLLCRGRIDVNKAQAELMTPEERKRLSDEGYAPALEGVEPAVVAFTTSVASIAVGELLERFVHYGIEPTPSEILLRLHDREISYNHSKPNSKHFCDPASGKIGLGMGTHFLDFPWPL